MASQPFLTDDFDDQAPDQAPAGKPEPVSPLGGRPKNARNRKHQALEAAARSRALPLLLKVIAAAEAGDMQAAKIVFDRIWPKPRTAPIQLEMAKTETPADVRAAMLDIISRVAAGEITTDDGAAIVSMMKNILDAHSIKTLSPDTDNESISGDAKTVFTARLQKIIGARAVPVEDTVSGD